MGDAVHMVDDQLRLILANKGLLQWNEALGIETRSWGKSYSRFIPFFQRRSMMNINGF